MPFYVNEYNVYIDIWSSRESQDLKMSVSEIVIVLCPLFHFLDECPTSWHATLVQMTRSNFWDHQHNLAGII